MNFGDLDGDNISIGISKTIQQLRSFLANICLIHSSNPKNVTNTSILWKTNQKLYVFLLKCFCILNHRDNKDLLHHNTLPNSILSSSSLRIEATLRLQSIVL